MNDVQLSRADAGRRVIDRVREGGGATTFFWNRLQDLGERLAIIAETETVTYAELARRADQFALRLPEGRQLIALEAANQVEAIVCYLACLRNNHPIILLSPSAFAEGRILDRFKPDFLYRSTNGRWDLEQAGAWSPRAFNDDLAVLLSTSGTTGSPKLVKLSRSNIQSNADSICTYLEIDAGERAITTLGFFYSYGMSVVNSHLAAGAALILTEASIVTPAFWECFKANAATSLAFVPHHFELLDQIDFIGMSLPSLHYVTQAGGRLDPDVARKYALLSLKRGWRFYVMYGQTEASPRMSYVPPTELLANPDTVGRAVPNGRLALIDEQGREIAQPGVSGELVYSGPNVMIGYAESVSDLAAPKSADVLKTGDIAVFTDTGHVRIVGRLGRFVKLYGLRISLDDVEGFVSRRGARAYCTGNDQCLAAFVEGEANAEEVAAALCEEYHLHRQNVFVKAIPNVPRLPSNKVDYRALERLIEQPSPPQENRDERLAEAFKTELSLTEVADTESFVSLGGDSLAYLALSLSLERRLGYLPRQWERMSLAALEALTPSRSRWSSLPVEVPLRVLAITTMVALHTTTWPVAGGPLALMFLSGYSIARSHGERLARGEGRRFLNLTLGRILLIYYGVLVFYFLLRPEKIGVDALRWFGMWANFQPLDGALYPYWYICAYAQIIVLLTLAWVAPASRRYFAARRSEFGYVAFAVGLAAALVVRLVVVEDELRQHNSFYLLCVFSLGWTAFHADSKQKKLIASVMAMATAALFWAPSLPGEVRTFYVLAASLAVIWWSQIAVPKSIGSTLSWLATISFYVYILHIIPVLLFTKQRMFPGPILELGNMVSTLVVSVVLAGGLTWAMSRGRVLDAKSGGSHGGIDPGPPSSPVEGDLGIRPGPAWPTASSRAETNPTVFIVGPDGQAGGGMGRIKDYILSAGANRQIRFESLVTRDQKGVLTSLALSFRAGARLTASALAGRKALVHINMGDAGSAVRKGALTIWARLIGTPVCLHLHAVRLHTLYDRSGPLVRFFIRQPFHAANVCVVLGTGWRDWLENELKVPRTKIEIVNNGVPVPTRPVRLATAPVDEVDATIVAGNRATRLLFLGNLLERKGVSDLLSAIAGLPAELTNWTITFAGGGDVERYRRLAVELGLEKRARFVGWVDQAGARALLAESDLLILPSYDEGLPLVILEALGSGVPVLCSPVGSIPEHLSDGLTARFVAPGDVVALRDRIAELIVDTGLRDRLAHAGLKLFCERFTLSAFADALFEVYRRRFGVDLRASVELATEPNLQ